MTEIADALARIADQVRVAANKLDSPEIRSSVRQLMEAVGRAGAAFCGSWIGYHSRVYYRELTPPPAGASFSVEWGLMGVPGGSGTRGDWGEVSYEEMYEYLERHATGVSLGEISRLADGVSDELGALQDELLSCLSAVLDASGDDYIRRKLQSATDAKSFSATDFAKHAQPKGSVFSRDSRAYSAGPQVPPHIALGSRVQSITSLVVFGNTLASIARQTASHLARRVAVVGAARATGTKVFIGHGRSPLWRDVKDFVQDRLGLDWDEFNRVPVAGITNIARLAEMLDDAGIALLIMTAEDETKDGALRARENVVHEAGLFQGKLGFTKAIVLLEDECEEFSNIHGLGQLRFPKGNIKVAFEEIRRVLEREGLLPEQS